MDSRLGFPLQTPFEESLVIPLVGGKHVGAVVDTQNRHLLGVAQVLQQLVVKTCGAKVEEKKEHHLTGATQSGTFFRISL